MPIAAAFHSARVQTMASELTTAPTEKTVFSRLIDRIGVYKTYAPQTQEDFADIIAAANELLKACGK
jgi:hypothetical protein